MRATQRFSIELSEPVADLVRAKVSAGDFASESEFIESTLLGQLPDQGVDGFEQWLRTTGVQRYDESVVSPDEVFTENDVLAAAHEALERKALAR